jgi:hypothetical protein
VQPTLALYSRDIHTIFGMNIPQNQYWSFAHASAYNFFLRRRGTVSSIENAKAKASNLTPEART